MRVISWEIWGMDKGNFIIRMGDSTMETGLAIKWMDWDPCITSLEKLPMKGIGGTINFKEKENYSISIQQQLTIPLTIATLMKLISFGSLIKVSILISIG